MTGVADSKDAQLLYSVINGETDLSAETASQQLT